LSKPTSLLLFFIQTNLPRSYRHPTILPPVTPYRLPFLSTLNHPSFLPVYTE
jgi:hypothetical protein